MVMARVGVRTNDFQLAYRLIKKLRHSQIKYVQLEYDAEIPSDIIFWFGTDEEVRQSTDKNGVSCDIDEVDITVQKYINIILAGPNVELLSFGVDTGPRPGLAWFADGRLIGSLQLEEVDSVVKEINQIIYHISPKSSIIRIGKGPRTLSNRIVNNCLDKGFSVELVDENNTSFGSRHDHVSSAKNIALKKGISVFKRLKVIPTKGEVREIQRISRLASQGKSTIPSNLARSVATGRISLTEALHLHLNDY
ncbi:MAG: hypothetical protein CND89_03725 [Marine Group II euryarchaeote MED-G38]|nr:MAG: hypothetical protein CND89_03725 [Marine Group II euryarchaeote MED-G38]